MFGKTKNAWITAAVDEETALQAIVLAKSLSRVVTVADTVVLVPEDVPDHLGTLLAQFFDFVITVELGNKPKLAKLQKIELLIISSWNVASYSKCVVLFSNKMVMKNSDELFDIEDEFSTTEINNDENQMDVSVMVIKPGFKKYKLISKLSTLGQFSNLSDLLSEHFLRTKKGILHETYNMNISTRKEAKEIKLHDVKILSAVEKYEHSLNGFAKNPAISETFQKLDAIWNASLMETEEEIKKMALKIGSIGNSAGKSDTIKGKYAHYKDSIAIVGHSCRFPGANNSDEFWDLIKSGGDGIRSVPVERLLDFQLNDSRFTESKAGFLKCPIDEFDAKFFGISPREAAFMDPQQRLLVEVAWEALENAAINPQSLKGSNTGVFTGVWTHDYERLIAENSTAQDFHHVILGNAFSATSARVSYFLGLNGPNVATESGCSSSMVALHLACDSLRKRESNLGLVLGANIIILQLPLGEIPILAKDGHCKTFDESADGFGRAEGVAVIVLKRLPDAIKNGDRILGVIRGSAVSNEGTSSNFGTPSKLCQEIAIKDALHNAGVKPGDVDYVEAHGTGTPIGDPIEFAALSAGYTGERNNPLLIGSVKTNTGHTESAAGLAGLIKVILAMENEIIPPHRNFTKLNPGINLNVVPAVIPLVEQPWCRNSNRVRMAGVSSFGISGTNVHVIVEEPPCDEISRPLELNVLESEKSVHILTLSAKSENALKDLANVYANYLSRNPEVNIADFTFTCNNGRAHLKYRLAITGKTAPDFHKALENDVYNPLDSNEKPKIAFLFTGQGSQYFGMAKSLFKSNFDFRHAFNECENIIQSSIGISLKNALWNDSNENLLEQTVCSQLSIFAVEYGLLKLWESIGVVPDVVLGHSVGEFAAAVAAGIIDLKDALGLLAERSRLIQSLQSGGMVAIRSSKEKVSQLMSKFLNVNSDMWLDIAVINSNEEVVVAGNKISIEAFKIFCGNNDTKIQMLAASHAFHSREMDKIKNVFGEFCNKLSYKSPRCQYVSGTTGMLLSGNEMDGGGYWLRHAREPVDFQKGMQTLGDRGCNIFIEIGAHPVLLALGMNNLNCSEKMLWLPSLRRNKDDWETLLGSMGSLFARGLNLTWKSLDKYWSRKKLQLPTYPFQRQKYWTDVSTDNHNKIVHPLLGKRILLADVSENIYEHKWDLDNLTYIKDHQVAHIIIMPGAGFLEVILAAGKDILLKNLEEDMGILTVKDFVVEAPLELEEGKKYKIQVVASAVENNRNLCHIKVYLFQKLNGYNNKKGWKRYSSGYVEIRDSISWPKNKDATDISSDSDLNPDVKYVSETVDNIKLRCPTEQESSEFYKLAPEIGIYFGETFQSIETVWAGENEAVALIPIPMKAGNIKDYVYHPIILDAMIQLFGLSIGKDNVDLYLPIGVDYVFLVNDTLSECVFAHAKWTEGQSVGTVALYSDKNVLLAVMAGVRLMRTSVSSFTNVINASKNMLPGMYQEVWRQRIGPLQARIDIMKIAETKNIIEPLFESMEQHMHMFDVEVAVWKANEAICLGIMKMLLTNGFSPKVGHIYIIETLMNDYMISRGHAMQLKRFFEILCEDGYGVEIDNGSGFMHGWKCIKDFPTIEELQKRSKSIDDFIYIEGASLGRTIVPDITHKCSDHLWDVLIGQKTAVSALFGSDDLNPLDVYTKSNECIVANMRAGRYLGLALKEFKSDGKKEDSIVRIIEIGAGSGATTKEVLAILQKEEIPFRYTFTDVSPHFFDGAKELFSGVSGIDYKVLDIEKDPSTQGFCPNYYDVVVAANVIHATENLKSSMSNIRKLICSNGILVLEEITYPSRAIDIIFGILEGYWKFTDYDVRYRHPMVSLEVWNKVLVESGFTEAVNVSSKDEFISVLASRAADKNISQNMLKINPSSSSNKKTAWVVYSEEGGLAEQIKRTFASVCDEVIFIDNKALGFKNENMNHDSDPNQSIKDITAAVLQNYDVFGIIYLATNIDYNNKDFAYKSILNICQYLSEKANHYLQFIIVTKGVYYIQNQKTVCPFSAAIWGMAKSMASETPKMQGKMIDLDPDNIPDEVSESKQIFFEAFDKEETLICFRNQKRFVSRLIKFAKPLAPLALPQGRYQIDIPKSKKINDLSFSLFEKECLGPKNMEVIVKAVAFNFRDIFVILKPEMYSTLKETVGSDFSGIVSNIGSAVTKFNIGDEVYGVSLSSAVGSHAITHEDIVKLKPKELTFSDAATIPSVLLTAFHCIVDVAALKKGEIILIHVASGGVGLVAIQIAKSIGAKIIATAGSSRKRNYLRSLGIEHVFHSRDLTYGDEIARVTNGRGVDMVLNSLTGHGFKETSLKSCAKDARFVEMGKVNIWKPEEVLELRPDVQYTIVDLEKMEEKEMGQMLGRMKQILQSDESVTPLPYSRFEVVNIRDALNYFLKAQHIGKVVVTMPDITEMGNQMVKKDALFSKNATYLITGGLGGIGLEVAKWMTDSGCKNLVLVGRSPPSEGVVQVLNNLRAKGCKVLSFQVDVGNWDECKSLFNTVKSSESRLPPLRGVIHSAGVISDAIYMNQTWEKYQTVFNAKLTGCVNLHNLTKELNLEHFVLFSSMAGLLGPMGQSNHAAANAFLDSFAHYRHSIGLPAQTINWGGWAEVGAASNTAYGKEGMFGVKPFTPNQGIATLKFIMSRPDLLQVGVVQVEIDEFKQYFSLGNTLSELVDDNVAAETVSSSIQSEKFWSEIGPLSLEDRNLYIKGKLTAIIRKTLKLPESEAIDEFQTFQEMGLDSLMAVEMKNKLQNIVGKKITLNVAAMMDYPTISSLGKYLAEQTMNVEIGSTTPETEATNIEFDKDAMYELLKQDCILSNEIRGNGVSGPPSAIENILLTGSTGHFGAYLLTELMQRENINICCLIRGKSAEQARRKLVANLKKYDLFDMVDFNKISIVAGDITEENLGIPIEEYNKLSAKTDMVFHLAVKANHVEKYQINKVNKMDIRTVNVLGTINILKFAANIKTKRILYSSSFTTVNRFTEEGFIYEEFPDDENNADELILGYSVSKFVCEKLLRQANENGIPCTVIRYSSLMGHSETGRFAIDTNSLMNSYFLSLRLGTIPDVEGSLFAMPVDVASKLTLELVFNNNTQSGVFNLVQPVPMYTKDFLIVAKHFGYNITVVSTDEYEQILKKETETNSFLTIFKDSYGKGSNYLELSTFHPALRRLVDKKTNVNCISDKCRKLIPDIEERIPHPHQVFKNCILYSNRYGLLERFGIPPISSPLA